MKPVTVAGTNVHGAPIGSHTVYDFRGEAQSVGTVQTWNQCNEMLLTSQDKPQAVLLMDTETGATKSELSLRRQQKNWKLQVDSITPMMKFEQYRPTAELSLFGLGDDGKTVFALNHSSTMVRTNAAVGRRGKVRFVHCSSIYAGGTMRLLLYTEYGQDVSAQKVRGCVATITNARPNSITVVFEGPTSGMGGTGIGITADRQALLDWGVGESHSDAQVVVGRLRESDGSAAREAISAT